MRARAQKSKFIWFAMGAFFVSAVMPTCLLGDEKDNANVAAKSDTPNSSVKSAAAKPEAVKTAAKPAESKVEAPAPLTERERWLLDRVEQLEKRVAELEARSNPGTAAPAEAVAARPAASGATQPVPLNTAVAITMASPASAEVEGTSAGAANLTNVSENVATGHPLAALSTKQEQAAGGKPAKAEPFAFADFTWLNGNARTKEIPLDTKFFTPEIRADVDYNYSFNHPKDDTISGSSEVFRHGEVQVTQIGVGGDFHYDNVRARLMTQFGMYSQTTPRNDASPSRGQWNLDGAYRYVSEAYGGYHFNALHGINLDAGIFMSYVGLFSYYNFDNWAYQPSYVSSNTPWFFNGVRVQIFPTEHLKIEPWFTNGWQSYGRFNARPGFGMQILWRPNGWFSVLGNQYTLGEEAFGVPGRVRYHSDDSIQIKYYENQERLLSKAAFSLTGDIGCEHGGGVSCIGTRNGHPKQSFLGFMFYNRLWFDRDTYGLTLGGGRINNPGRYLVLLPPINGATAASGTPYFTENPGDPFKAWDASGTFDWMPSQYITFRWEFDHRAANVPYWSGPGGVTPPLGNTFGAPGALVCSDGTVAPIGGCGAIGLWTPDLKKIENRINLAILVKF
ncbi:MAG TPA: outer membrane beta-barrel protein [Methylomirabilota bacterium]|nr:outer membrane beta-barrel protein [Methylomirabilota bacterium]